MMWTIQISLKLSVTLRMKKVRKTFIVVDLQGVFTLRPNGERVYKLTDPAIHTQSRWAIDISCGSR